MKISLWVFLAMAATMEVGVIATMSKVRLVDNGYEGVVVGVSPRVPSSDAHRIVDSLKEMLKEGSKAMLKATRRRAFLRDVIILVPPSWQQVESDKLPNMLLRYEDSDIRVDMPNIIYQDQPYTLQSGQCGQPGQYIHYTPAYLTDDTMTKRWGPRGTSLVYEWAKLRWGVFEEIGFAGDPIYPAYYYSKPHGGSAVPTMCGPKYIAGDWKNGRGGNCTLTLNDVPQKHCSFEGRNCSSVSLMSMNVCPFAELEFCDAESHNSHAPTKHNELCGRKSIWEIMEGHRDFASGANPSLNRSAASDAPEPRVRVVRAGRPDVAMVIDTSGSMNLLRRYDRLKKAISQWFLLDAPEDITMALIKFSGTAEVLQNLTRLNTQEKKLAFISRLDLKPAGGTGIGNGLLKALQVLKNEKKLIYLVNDGEENTEPYVKDVMGDVLRSGATVITLGIGPRADLSLEELSMQTSGISFAIGDERYDFTIEDSLEAIHSFLPSHTERTMVCIYKKIIAGVIPEGELTGHFNVDCTASKVVFTLDTENGRLSEPQLERPDGKVVKGRFEKTFQTWVIDVPDPEVGTWQWRATVKSEGLMTVRVRASMMVNEGLNYDTVKIRHWVESLPDGHAVVAEVKEGTKPVLKANVSAEVYNIATGAREVLQLRDNGVGSDAWKGDGLYSRYVIAGNGRHSIKIMVRGTNETFVFGGNRRHRHRRELLQKRRPAYCCGSTIPNAADSEKTGSFSRFTSSGSIKITKAPPKGSLPPAPVRDLRVSALTPRGFQLAWTATGDDLDTGVVSDYELLMLYNWTSRTRIFDQVSSVNLSSHVTPHDLKTKVLVEPGTKVVVNVSLELGHYNFLAIKAIDALGIKSNDSNLVALSYAKENDSRTTAASVITPSYSSEEDIQPTDPSITSDSTNTIGNPDNTCDPRNSSNHINCPHSSKNEESANRMTAVIAILSLLGFLVILGIVCVVHYFRRRRRFDM